MTELYINNQLVDLPTDFKVTLVTENLYFSSASTYTFDVKLPMAPCSNNARIFANINRLDKSVTAQSLPARLLADNRLIINGIANIVDISDDSITVQLLQGRSDLNWKQKHQNTYVDELDLGDGSEWGLGWEDGHLTITVEPELYQIGNYDDYFWTPEYMAQINNGNVLFTPIINATTGEVMNPVALMILENWGSTGGQWLYRYCLNDIDNTTLPSGWEKTIPPSRLAPQPKLSLIIEKVFAALDMPVVYNELSGTAIYDNMFLANASEVYHIAEMLPHWTVVEFINEVQNLFNCVIDVRPDGTHIALRRNFYADSAANAVELRNPLDEFAVEVDLDTSGGVSDSDLPKKYDIKYPDYDTMYLGEDFAGVAILPKTQLTTTANPYVFARTNYGAKVSSPKLDLIGNVTGQAIDHFEDMPADEGQQRTSLRLIPIRPLSDNSMSWHYTAYQTGVGEYVNGKEPYNYTLYLPTAEGKDTEIERQNIQDLLDALETPEERPTLDRVCLGFLTAKFYKEAAGEYTGQKFPILISHNKAAETNSDGQTIAEQPYDMALTDRINPNNGQPLIDMYATYYKNTPVVAVNKSTVQNFVVKGKLLDPLKTYLIHNQLFACQQIKYTIDAKGFQPIAEGTFYKL